MFLNNWKIQNVKEKCNFHVVSISLVLFFKVLSMFWKKQQILWNWIINDSFIYAYNLLYLPFIFSTCNSSHVSPHHFPFPTSWGFILLWKTNPLSPLCYLCAHGCSSNQWSIGSLYYAFSSHSCVHVCARTALSDRYCFVIHVPGS